MILTEVTSIISLVIGGLSLLGVGTIFATLWQGFFSKKAKKRQNKEKNEEEFLLLKEGIQALLRAEMIKMYNEGISKGYAHIYEKENFENCYNKYHNLGANGVITGLYDVYMSLPTEKVRKTRLNESKN